MWQHTPKGDMKQGRYGMTLSDLMNTHYTNATNEGLDSFKPGRAGSRRHRGHASKHIPCMQGCHVGLELARNRHGGMATSKIGLGDV